MNKLETQNPLPSLEKAKEICKMFDRPLNGTIIILSAVVPMVNTRGIYIGESVREAAQKEANRNGLLVVLSPFDKETTDKNNMAAIFEGERVLYNPQSPVSFMITITSEELVDNLNEEDILDGKLKSEMYKKYVIMGMHCSNFVATVK